MGRLRKKTPVMYDVKEITERLRRSHLYDVSRTGHFPKTKKIKTDRRVNKKIAQATGKKIDTRFVDIKHQEGRPPVAKTLPRNGDLHSTVPHDITRRKKSWEIRTKHDKQWRVGYHNSAASYHLSAQGADGILEPSEGAKEIILKNKEFRQVSMMYPPRYGEAVVNELDPEDWTDRFVAQAASSVHTRNTPKEWDRAKKGNNSSAGTLSWKAPRSPTSGMEGNFSFKLDKVSVSNSRTPTTGSMTSILREGIPQQSSSFDIHGVRKEQSCNFHMLRKTEKLEKNPLEANLRDKKKRLAQLQEIEKVMQHRELMKQKRNSHEPDIVPATNPELARTYRLGIEPIDDKTLPSGYVKHRAFLGTRKDQSVSVDANRPKTAAGINQRNTIDRVVPSTAGALRRPKTASLSLLKNSTVCIRARKSPYQLERDANRKSIERERRKAMMEPAVKEVLAKKEFNIQKISYVFGHLRHYAIENFPKHMQAFLETVSWEKYYRHRHGHRASITVVRSRITPSQATVPEEEYAEYVDRMFLQQRDETGGFSPPKERVPPTTTDISQDITPMTNQIPVLWVNRSQFTNAMVKFCLPMRAINALFSAFDEEIHDRIDIGNLCEVFMAKRIEKKKVVFGKNNKGDNAPNSRVPQLMDV